MQLRFHLPKSFTSVADILSHASPFPLGHLVAWAYAQPQCHHRLPTWPTWHRDPSPFRHFRHWTHWNITDRDFQDLADPRSLESAIGMAGDVSPGQLLNIVEPCANISNIYSKWMLITVTWQHGSQPKHLLRTSRCCPCFSPFVLQQSL